MSPAGAMAEIEAWLQALMVDNGWSKTKLKEEVRERGICLRNGKEYGRTLPTVLRKQPALLVYKQEAKKYRLAKTCLVHAH